MPQTITRTPATIVTEVIRRLFAGDYSALDGHPGLESLRHHFPAFKAAFPDLTPELQQQMVDGDRVATHWIFSGTHLGVFQGIAPTGKRVRMQNVSIARVQDGRIVQYNSELGWLTGLTQMGVLPAGSGKVEARSETVAPDRLLAMGTGFWLSQIVHAASHYRFFTIISQGHATAAAVARAAGTDPRGTRMVLDSLVAVDVLSKRGDEYSLTPEADAFLVEGRPGDLTPMLDIHTALTWDGWAKLSERLSHPDATRAYADLDKAQEFFPKLIRAIQPLGLGPADAVAEHLGVGSTWRGVRILDIGAGGAAWSMPFARRDSSARVIAFDLPDVLVETKEIVSSFGLHDSFTMREGNLLTDDFGNGAFDLVILGNICHGLTPDQNRDLLRRAHRALAAGGRLLIAEMIPNEERTGPPFPVLFAVNMFVMGGVDTYPLSEYRQWLGAAGYRDVTTFDTRRSHSPVIIARK